MRNRQSRSSPYAEYASCIGAPKHQGAEPIPPYAEYASYVGPPKHQGADPILPIRKILKLRRGPETPGGRADPPYTQNTQAA